MAGSASPAAWHPAPSSHTTKFQLCISMSNINIFSPAEREHTGESGGSSGRNGGTDTAGMHQECALPAAILMNK